MEDNLSQNEYNIAATEVLYILDYLPKSIVYKIPSKFKMFLKENAVFDYNPNFDFSKGLDKLELNDKTRALLAMIYRNYICSKEEKIEYDKILYQNEENYQKAIREIYNPDNIFKPKTQINVSEKALVEYKEPKWYQKLFKKITNLLNRLS